MNQQSVADLRRKVNETQKVLDLNLDNWDPRTKPGMEGRRNKAAQEIEGLKAALARQILQTSTAMLILDDVKITPEVVKAAKEKKSEIILLDFLSTEKWLVKTIYGDTPPKGGYPFNSSTLNRMNILVSDEVGDKIAADSMPLMSAPAKLFGTSKTKEEILQKMSSVMYDAYSTELKEHLFRVLISEGIYDRLQSDEVSVFIVNVPRVFVKPFSSYAGKTIVVTEDQSLTGAALVLDETANAEELVAAVTKAQTIVKKRVRNTTKRNDEGNQNQ